MEFEGSAGRKRRRSKKCGMPNKRVRLELQALEARWAPAGITKLSQWNNGTADYSDGWAMTQLNKKYAYIGHYGNNNGIHIVDITNPVSPVLVGNFKSPSGWNDFRDVELVQRGRRTFGFFSSDSGGGLIVANVSNPANPVELKRITSAHNGHDNVHTLSVDGNYLFEADSRTSTIKVFNITNPQNPTFLRNINSVTSAVHEVTALNGRLYAAGIFSSPRVEIYDISQVGNLGVPVTRIGTVFSGSRAHTAWPTPDGQFVAVAHEREGGELSLWDISNLNSPQLAWTLSLPTGQAYSVHQVMTNGNRMYISWYQAGIFVYDIADPYNPVLLGSYDTYAGGVNFFDGAWGVYPYLGDNELLGFDIQGGIFVLSLDTRSGSESPHPVSPVITLSPEEKPIDLVGGVLRIVVDNSDHEVAVSSNSKTGMIEVKVDSGEAFAFPADEVLRMNIYSGDGSDRFVFGPNLTMPIYLDGGAGSNRVDGWPGLHAPASVQLEDLVHCVWMDGSVRGQRFEAHNIQVFDGAEEAALITAHGMHPLRLTSSPMSNGTTVVTGDHAAMLAGSPNNGSAGRDSMTAALMGSFHGGKISPELMVRTSTNSQVGGQVAYHKPG